MSLLKQSTAATIEVGPVFDQATGLAYALMTISDFSISKNGTTAAMAAAATATHTACGMYSIALTTGNTDTAGRLAITCNKTGYVMGLRAFTVLKAAAFDAIVTDGDIAQAGAAMTLTSDYNAAKTAGTSTLTAAQILKTPANLLDTDADGKVTTSNPATSGVTEVSATAGAQASIGVR